ncbi:MAG: hypothetical protein KC589_07670 [Nanoarchaeota archaeon]|nr:hypothetical protein [Nanoarchaeota archaeon]
MKKISINSNVENGLLKSNKKAIRTAIESFEGKQIRITIERKRKVRSTPQNRYYWGVVIPLIQSSFVDTWGERKTKEEIHEFLKREFQFTEYVNENTGEIIKVGKSTTENTTVEFEEFMDDCRNFAQEWFGVIIPLPNEQMELEIE